MIACFKVKVMGAIGPGIFWRVPTIRKVLNRDIALAAQFSALVSLPTSSAWSSGTDAGGMAGPGFAIP